MLYPTDVQSELRDLIYVLREVDWHELGIQLKVPSYVLRNIDRENPGNESRKLSEVLQFCKENREASWEKIVEALQRIGGHGNIITNIQSEYMTQKLPHISPTDSDLHIESRSLVSEISHSHVTDGPLSLEEKLSKFPGHLLDSPCNDADLVKLSQSIIQWRDLSPYLRLTPAEETRILTAFPPTSPARQCIDMLRTWREKFGTKANYR